VRKRETWDECRKWPYFPWSCAHWNLGQTIFFIMWAQFWHCIYNLRKKNLDKLSFFWQFLFFDNIFFIDNCFLGILTIFFSFTSLFHSNHLFSMYFSFLLWKRQNCPRVLNLYPKSCVQIYTRAIYPFNLIIIYLL
jgi:hypothetical protein